MKKALKTLGRFLMIVALLIALTITAAGIYLEFFFDANAYKPLVTKEVSKYTGRELALGDVKIEIFSFTPGIVLKDVTFSNASRGDKRPMAKVDEVIVRVSLFALAEKKIRIVKAVVNKPDILLQIDESGKANWEFDVPKTEGKKMSGKASESERIDDDAHEDASSAFRVDMFQINQAKIVFKDESTAEKMEKDIEIPTLSVTMAGPAIKLSTALEMMDTKIEASALVRASKEEINIDSFTFTGFSSDVKGSGKVGLGKKLDIDMKLASNKVDLTRFMPADEVKIEDGDFEETTSIQPKDSDRVFPNDALPFNYLDQKMKLAVNYTIGQLILKDYAIKDIDTSIKMNNGKLEALLKGKAGNGALVSKTTASLLPNKKDARINLTAEMDVTDLATFSPPKYKMSGGKTKLTADITAGGRSIAGIASSLTGDILLDISEVKASVPLVGKKDLDLKVSCAVANIELVNGTADLTRKVALETDQGDLVSEGKLDLGDEFVDVAVRVGNSYHKKATLSDMLIGNLHVKGHFSKIKVKISKTGLVTGTARTLLQGQSVLQTEAMSDRNPCQTAKTKGKLQNKQQISKDGVVGTVRDLVADPKNAGTTLKDAGKSIEKNVKSLLRSF